MFGYIVLHAVIATALVTRPATASADEIIIITDDKGSGVDTIPEDFYLVAGYTASENVSGEGVMTISVKREEASWLTHTPRTVYSPTLGAWLTLDYKVDVSVNTGVEYRQSGNKTIAYGGIDASVEAEIHITFNSPPRPGNYDLGRILEDEVFRGKPRVRMLVQAYVYLNGTLYRTITISDIVEIDLRNLNVKFTVLKLYIKTASLNGYVVTGDLNTGATMKPVYSVTVCGNLEGSQYRIPLKIHYGGSQSTLVVDGDPEEECVGIPGVYLTPGSTTPIKLAVESPAFTYVIERDVYAEGAIVSFAKPTGYVIVKGGRGDVNITVPIYVSGLFSSDIVVKGKMYNAYLGERSCQTLTIKTQGDYRLYCYYSGPASTELINSTFTVKLEVTDPLGNKHFIDGEALVNGIDPSNIADVVWQVYRQGVSFLFAAAIVVIVLIIISLSLEILIGRQLLDVTYLSGMLVSFLVSGALLAVLLPGVYGAFLKVLSSTTFFGRYIDVSSLQGASTLEIFKHMLSYYDKLFDKITGDFTVYFLGSLNDIIGAIKRWIALALSFLGIAIGLSIFFGAGIPYASIAQTFLTMIFSILSIMIMMAPAGAIALTLVAIGRFIILMAMVLVVVFLTIGLLLIAIPSPYTQRLGEDLFSASLMFMIALPLMGPLIYSLYNYIIEVGVQSVQSTISITLGIVNLVIPIGPLVTIMVYLATVSFALTAIIMLVAGLLSRAGIAVGLGEALSALTWRF
jgi:hypothetical protein